MSESIVMRLTAVAAFLAAVIVLLTLSKGKPPSAALTAANAEIEYVRILK